MKKKLMLMSGRTLRCRLTLRLRRKGASSPLGAAIDAKGPGTGIQW